MTTTLLSGSAPTTHTGRLLRIDHRTAWILTVDRGRITGSHLVGEYADGSRAGWIAHTDGTETVVTDTITRWADAVRAEHLNTAAE